MLMSDGEGNNNVIKITHYNQITIKLTWLFGWHLLCGQFTKNLVPSFADQEVSDIKC